jgi:hypothetical protein
MAYRSRRKKKNVASQLVGALAVVSVGAGAFWFALGNFRETRGGELALEVAPAADASEVEGSSISAPFISAFDGATTGTLTRTFEDHGYTHSALAHLPAIDQNTEQYDIWVIREGLSDVQYAGTLSPRADGTWAATFRVAPESGYRDPARYNIVNIWRAPKGRPSIPVGQQYVSASLAEE